LLSLCAHSCKTGVPSNTLVFLIKLGLVTFLKNFYLGTHTNMNDDNANLVVH
jgi:hypothetical protein